MLNQFKHMTFIALATFSVAACDSESSDDQTNGAGGEVSGDLPPQCDSDGYQAFDAANYQNQILRIQAVADMTSAMKAAADAEPFSASAVHDAFVEAKRLYVETASLQEKVQGRTDDHLDGPPAVGVELDAQIVSWLDRGAAAQDALAATVSRQWVEKSLAGFFFLSVHHEMMAGARKNWDEAFGYYGAPADNAEGGRTGFSGVATKRDATNGTGLASEIFNGLVDGSCELAKALAETGTETLDLGAAPAVTAMIDATDQAMQRTLAFSAGHEAFEMAEVQQALATDAADTEAQAEMWIKLAEMDPFFQPIERLMRAKGGESKTRADEIRATLDAAWANWETRETGWMVDFDAAGIVTRLEAEFGIDVKG